MKRLIPLLLIAPLAVTMSGCSGSAAAVNGPMDMEAMTMEEAVAVETVQVSRASIDNTLTYSGTVEYSDSYNVVPEVAGKVKSIYFDVGDAVSAGDVLFEIDDREIRENIQQLNASLTSSNASVQVQQTQLEQLDGSTRQTQLLTLNTNISNAENSVETAKIALTNAEASQVQAENNKNTAKQDYDNTQVLYNAGAASQIELDNAKNTYESAMTSYETAQRSVEQSRLSLQQAEEQLENARTTYDITVNQTMEENKKTAQNSLNSAIASRNAISVQLEQAQAKLEMVSVKSPVTGIVSQKNVELGENVSTASVTYTIVNASKVSVKTYVTEQLVEGLQVGDAVTVVIKTLSDEPLYGAVATISPVTDSSGTYPVTVEIENAGGKIKSGMFAEITFSKEKNDNTIAVTKDAVLTDENGNYVYIVVDGAAKRVDVQTGIDNGQALEITGGLNEGDEVIVKGQNSVYEGSPVNIVNTELE